MHALVGENGAGKTTLIRVACGLVAPERGEVLAGGVALPQGDPRAAIRAGIGVVHQHFMLVPTLSVADNVALGVEPRRGLWGLELDRERVHRELEVLAREQGLPVAPGVLVETLAVGERQRVEILKALVPISYPVAARLVFRRIPGRACEVLEDPLLDSGAEP